METVQNLKRRIAELEQLLETSERKADILTNLLKEASAEYEHTLENIKVSEANFRAIFENAPQAIYIIETKTRKFIDCNPLMETWLGYSRAELLTMRLEQILSSNARLGIKENINRTVNNGFIHIQARGFIKKDNSIVEAEVTGTLLNYQGKRCAAVLVRDITQKKQIQTLGRYKELFENVSDPVFINDAQGKFLEINDVACDFFGYSRKELLKMSLQELTWPGHFSVLTDMKNKLAELKNKKIRKKRTFQFELNLMTREGHEIPFELQGKLINHRRRSAFLSVARNLSFRKQLEKTLIRAERLSAVGEMASGVAHNFNNLLQMIMAGAEVAKSKLASGRIRDCDEAIQNIFSASRRGADVVRRIKDFTQADINSFGTGKVFDLNALVSEAIELTRPLWKPPSSPQKYHLNLIHGENCFVKGVSSEIYEVLVNLIKNSIEAMPTGGSLSISTYTNNNKVNLVVADTGIGIPEEHFQRIFQPFYTTKGTQSSGLGLSSCYGIIKKFQGDIHLKSQLGNGTIFSVSFPLAAPEEIEIETQIAPQEHLPIRFLLIDDEVNILKSMEMYFEDSEIDITTAVSGEDGIRLVYKDDFDVVLCDFGMDDMNGLEVGKEIKSYYEQARRDKIPFLLYTGLDKQLDEQKLQDCGVNRVVNKPTSCRDLHSIISEIVSNNVAVH